MALWGCPHECWGCRYTVLSVAAVLERVRGARFVVLRPPFASQTVRAALYASVFMCASLIDFCSRKISSWTLLWITAFSAQLVRSHCSTTRVTERIA